MSLGRYLDLADSRDPSQAEGIQQVRAYLGRSCERDTLSDDDRPSAHGRRAVRRVRSSSPEARRG